MNRTDNPNFQHRIQESKFAQGIVYQGVRELAYGVVHYGESRRNKKRVSLAEAQEFSELAKMKLGKGSPYFGENDNPMDIKHVASGYYASVYSFHSKTGNWVIKLGTPHSPMRSYFHPNSPEFADWFQYGLDIQKEIYSDSLPFLIPEPQTIVYLEGSRNTTANLQPLDTSILTKEQIKLLPGDDKKRLLVEFDTFHKINREMREKYRLMPDFEVFSFIRNTSHFAISKRSGDAHLTLHDSGLIDGEAPMPIVYLLNILHGEMMINSQKRKLRRMS